MPFISSLIRSKKLKNESRLFAFLSITFSLLLVITIMRRLSFTKLVDQDDDDGFYLPRVSFEAQRQKPRRSFHRKSISLTSSLSLVNFRRSFNYDKLRQVPIQLTVIKLDGSCFGIEVDKTAKVAELKMAVERSFSHMPKKGPGKISWRHVWGHFCLCYSGQMLVDDRKSLNDYGIKDGDQLQFVRHVSIAYNLIKKGSKKRDETQKPPKIHVIEEQKIPTLEEEDCDHVENLKCQQCRTEDESSVMSQNESVMACVFKSWFLYSKLEHAGETKFDVAVHRARLADGLSGCFRSLFHHSYNKSPRYAPRVSQIEI